VAWLAHNPGGISPDAIDAIDQPCISSRDALGVAGQGWLANRSSFSAREAPTVALRAMVDNLRLYS